MIKIILHIVLLFFCFTAKAQESTLKDLQLDFFLFIDQNNVLENKNEYNIDKTNIHVDQFKCYLSSIKLFNEAEIVWEEQNSYHLLDMKNPESFHIICKSIPKEQKYTSLEFQLGIDSLTNVSGAMGGDLDPTKGMYWSWQSGYINFKIEGTHSESLERDKSYQLHLGGYTNSFATVQKIKIPSNSNSSIDIVIQLAQFFSFMQAEKHYRVMSPGENAVLLSEYAAKCFHEK